MQHLKIKERREIHIRPHLSLPAKIQAKTYMKLDEIGNTSKHKMGSSELFPKSNPNKVNRSKFQEIGGTIYYSFT